MDKDILPKLSAIALNSIFGYEPRFSHRIIDALGSAEAVFQLPPEEKRRIFGPCNKYLPLINDGSLEKAEAEYSRLRDEGVQVLSIFDNAYPATLRECDDAPIALYVRSAMDISGLFNRTPAISVVGTRDISPYGKEWCCRIVRALADSGAGPSVVSGLAIGVDVTAHIMALDCGLPTIAVLPVGIDDVYPARHRLVARRISETTGCALITDYPPGTQAIAFNFLRRNRIIAGIGQATILVESKLHGGGMMTARLASGYGRDVLALPGRMDDLRSQGCNLLIQEKIAEPVPALDILPRTLGLGERITRRTVDLEQAVRKRYSSTNGEPSLEELVSTVLAIRKERGISLDGLCTSLQMDYAKVSVITGILENDGFISVDLLQRCTINSKIY